MLELQRSVCAFCRATLKPDETYSCDECERENASIEVLEAGNDSQTPKAPEL
jgi:predicted amidophosphoribosyltransferase